MTIGKLPVLLDRNDKGTIDVQETANYEPGEDGMRVTLYREGLLFEGTTTVPCHFHMLISIDTLLKAWHQQNERIGH